MPNAQRHAPDCTLTVAICTHNPKKELLQKTLSSLRAQRPLDRGGSWELLLIDNASVESLASLVDLSWHPRSKIVREEKLGLSHARLKSFDAGCGDIIVYIDDDNVLHPDYLRLTQAAFDTDAKLGAVGGKVIPRYEIEPPKWFAELRLSLACRDLGDAPLSADWNGLKRWQRGYPDCSPIGAGMGVRRNAYAAYIRKARNNPLRTALGRRGTDLASGEDNDIVMSLLAEGWRVGYQPELQLEHLIPAHRLTRQYLARYASSSTRTWVQVLDLHHIRPWPPIPAWSLPLRKAKAFVRAKAWMSASNYIRWRAMCGLLEGQSTLET